MNLMGDRARWNQTPLSFFSSQTSVTAVTDNNPTIRNNWIDTGAVQRRPVFDGASKIAPRRPDQAI